MFLLGIVGGPALVDQYVRSLGIGGFHLEDGEPALHRDNRALVLSERGSPFANRVATLNVSSGGAVTGVRVNKALGLSGSAQAKLTGTLSLLGSGLRSLTLTAETTDDFGEVQSAIEQHVLVATTKDLRALRVDGGVIQVLTLVP